MHKLFNVCGMGVCGRQEDAVFAESTLCWFTDAAKIKRAPLLNWETWGRIGRPSTLEEKRKWKCYEFHHSLGQIWKESSCLRKSENEGEFLDGLVLFQSDGSQAFIFKGKLHPDSPISALSSQLLSAVETLFTGYMRWNTKSPHVPHVEKNSPWIRETLCNTKALKSNGVFRKESPIKCVVSRLKESLPCQIRRALCGNVKVEELMWELDWAVKKPH